MMPASISLNGNVTYETCPVCQELNIKIEHGWTNEMGGHPAHYETCPNCGTNIVFVMYDCKFCKQPRMEGTGVNDENKLYPTCP